MVQDLAQTFTTATKLFHTQIHVLTEEPLELNHHKIAHFMFVIIKQSGTDQLKSASSSKRGNGTVD